MKYITLSQMLDEAGRKYRRRTALVFGKKKISYDELNRRANQVARALLAAGVKEGAKVAILLTNCPEFIIGYFGILKAGAVAVPLNHMLKVEELRYILHDAEADTIITSKAFLDTAKTLRLRIKKLVNIILVDDRVDDSTSFLDVFQEFAESEINLSKDINDVAVILYTSGTTGYPKGAMLTHANLFSNAQMSALALEADQRRYNFICLLPLFHSFAATVCMLAPIYAGARIVIIDSIRPFHKVIKGILQYRVHIFAGIPSMYGILADLELPKFLPRFLLRLINPLKICISGADALSVETLKKFEAKYRIPLIEGYGLTEASPVVSLNPLRGVRKAGSIGLPLPGVETKVVSEAGNELRRGQVGELVVKGPNVMKGYFKLAEATAEAIKDGWLYTGDLTKMDEDGYMYIVDRKKDLLIVRGLNVYPREVEEVLYQHPKVKEAAVVGIADKHKGEIPKAFVVLREGHTVDAEEIIRFCRQRIASYKVPRSIEFRTSLPKTSTGKILKRTLKAEVGT